MTALVVGGVLVAYGLVVTGFGLVEGWQDPALWVGVASLGAGVYVTGAWPT
jgi:hypothetical protein